MDKLFDRNGGGRSADPGGDNADFFSVEIAGVGVVFPVLGDLYRVIEMFRNLLTAPRIARQDT